MTVLDPFTVMYDGNGGFGAPPVDPNVYQSGDVVTVLGPGELTRAGYTFVGWATDPSGFLQYQPGDTFTITADTTLYAVWEAMPLTVTYDGNGNDSGTPPVDPNTYHPGDTVTILEPGDLTKTGYVFTGWAISSDGPPLYSPGDTFTIFNDTTLYAVWTPTPLFTVTYDGNGNDSGTAPIDPNTYQSGDTVTILEPGDLTKTGYQFLGWSTDPNATTPQYQPGDTFTITSNTTLYAIWEAAPVSQMTLAKQVESSGPFEVGDTVTYTYTVANTGNTTLHGLTVTDDRVTGVTCDATVLAPGTGTTCRGSHTLTASDITPCQPSDGGCALTNRAQATATDPDGQEVASNQATATITVQPQRITGLTLIKHVASSGPFEVGDTVAYTYLVVNTGNTTLHGVTVTDDKIADVACGTTTLAPGTGTTCRGSHTLTTTNVTPCQTAMARGGEGYGDGQQPLRCEVTNTARATATDPQGGHVTSGLATATVIVEVEREHDGYGHRAAAKA
ncbi:MULTISPECIES: InlB B-repeat-containing protein [unclassified Streptomyces]|uniref:InlB B-repeat-containing protein n=1 Tax=unclassified Streptomyces TaxID=2593676 RepID=UPI001660A903|nr:MULTISPECIES: InlB B-repeat-containing protein [unclassified Streptomyces]